MSAIRPLKSTTSASHFNAMGRKDMITPSMRRKRKGTDGTMLNEGSIYTEDFNDYENADEDDDPNYR